MIVGGGVAGLGLATALAARNIPSTVFEKRAAPGEIDRGDILHIGSIRMIGRWGLGAKLEAASPLRFKRFRIYDNGGRVLFHVDLQCELGKGTWFTSLRHPEVESVLEQGALSSGVVDITRGRTVREIEGERGRVEGVVVDGRTVRADLTVLATGSRSSLVNSLFPKRWEREYGTCFYNARFRGSISKIPEAFYVIGARGALVCVPLPGDEVRIGLQYSTRNPLAHIARDNILESIGCRLSTLSLENLELIDARVYKLRHTVRQRFWRPGAVVIGDGAHTVHPIGGQGMNLALQDAERLATAVDRSDWTPSSIDAECRVFEQQRKHELWPVFVLTYLLGRVASWDTLPLRAMQRAMIAVMNKSRRGKQLLFRHITGVA